MTTDEAVEWLEKQGFRIRRFGPQINAAYGDVPPDEDGIRLAGRVMAQITPEQDGHWTLWCHGVTIRRLDGFDQAVHALRDYLLESIKLIEGTS